MQFFSATINPTYCINNSKINCYNNNINMYTIYMYHKIPIIYVL